jgi:hypothetical protein
MEPQTQFCHNPACPDRGQVGRGNIRCHSRQRRGRKRAIFALAHKILTIVFVWIRRGDDHRDATVNDEALPGSRNAPRWIRMRKKYGFIEATAQPAA